MYLKKRKQKYYNDYLNRLVKHPYQEVKKTQDFARFKQIRKASEKNMLRIKKGSIAIPQGFKIVPTKHGWKIKKS